MSALRMSSWMLTGLLAIGLLLNPVSVQAQLAFSLAIIIVLTFLHNFTRSVTLRNLYFALSVSVVVRYVYWRLTYTLPPISEPVGLILGLVLLGAELYCVAMLIAGLVVNADPLKQRPQTEMDDEDAPFVDVFIPSYDEHEHILSATIAAARSMDYPPGKLKVWLLDDGATDQKCNSQITREAERARARRKALESKCMQLNVSYLARACNKDAKAGNLNSGLAQSSGDIVVVLDADHAPFRSFLRETVGYFQKDPKLFLVQTPHVFLNPDPIERNLRILRRMPMESDMFYSVTQCGLDKWNAAFFCGSAALLRRAALAEIGGFSGTTVTEDCETALELHARGWSSMYLCKPLVAGLQPETFATLIRQRVRWCQGMLQILTLANPLGKRGLKPIQKLGYLSSMWFWLFPFPRLVFMLAPLTYLFFNVKIFVSNVDEVIAYTSTYIAVMIMLQNYLFERVRWPFVSELYEYCQCVFLGKAILSMIVNRRKPAFGVTPKGTVIDRDRLSELAGPFFAVYGLVLTGALVSVWRYIAEPGVANLTLFVGLWNGFNLILAGAALGVVAERKQFDRYPWLAVDRRGELQVADRRVPVIIEQVSLDGCRLRLIDQASDAPPNGEPRSARLMLESVDGDLPVIMQGAIADDEGRLACTFAALRSEEYFVLADLMYGDAAALARFVAARRKRRGFAAAAQQFLQLGLSEPLRACVYVFKPTPIANTEPLASVDSSFADSRRFLERARQFWGNVDGATNKSSISEKLQEVTSDRPRRVKKRSFFALIMALVAFIPHAGAEAFFQTAPRRVFNLNLQKTATGAATNSAASALAPLAMTTAPPPSSDDREKRDVENGLTLRHLNNNLQGFRLSGENASSEWPIYVTEKQSKRSLRFQIGYLAAAPIMPESSYLSLAINDRKIGETHIHAFRAVRTVSFAIPLGVMRPGFNAVRLSTNQRHRVDCSVEATHELWTQIDPALTGLIVAEDDAGLDNMPDLAALPPNEQGAVPVRAVIKPNSGFLELERMLRAVQLISIIGRFEQPVIDIGPMAGGRYGVNVLVGTAAELTKEHGLNVLSSIKAPSALVLPAASGRRTTVVITGATAADVEEAMKLSLSTRVSKGSAQGLRAAKAFPGFRIEGGKRVKLGELGLVSEEFSGRLFRAAFNIVMPPDFYPADYGRAWIRLAGGYAAGLNSNARIVVNVNGRAAVSLDLLEKSGDVFRDNRLPLALGFLRPGLNRIEIEAHVPTNGDAGCDTIESLRGGKRFLFLDSTEIELPAIARIARMPDLAVTVSGGFPFVNSPKRPKLFVPSRDEDTLGAAATIIAHLAVAADETIDFEIAAARPGDGDGPTLAIAPLDAFDPELLRRLGVPAARLRSAWRSFDRTEVSHREALSPAEIADRNRLVLQRNFPLACYPVKMMRPRNAGVEIDETPVGSIENGRTQSKDAQDLFQKWIVQLRDGRFWLNVDDFTRSAADWATMKFTDAANWASSGQTSEDASRFISPRTSLAIVQNVLGDSARAGVWTVVTAAGSAALAEAAACLVDPRVSDQISGRAATLDMSAARVSVLPADDSRFIVTQPLSLGNARLIVAGWLSRHSFEYASAAVALAALFAASTTWLLRNVGRKTS